MEKILLKMCNTIAIFDLKRRQDIIKHNRIIIEESHQFKDGDNESNIMDIQIITLIAFMQTFLRFD